MAHVEKYTRTQVNNLFRHYERAYITENVDENKSYLNYNLFEDAENRKGIDILQERLNNVHCLKRKDVNIMCSWIVTAPKTLQEEYHEQFFDECYKFLNDRYGNDNVIGAYVHMDEVQPHLHYVFVPVVHDNKKNINKVCAKDVINRKELKTFHKDLKRHLENKMNMQVDILNYATINGNKTVLELKRESTLKNIDVIESIEKIKRESAYNKIARFEELVKDAERNLESRQNKLEKLKEQVQNQEKKLNDILKEIDKTRIENNIYFNNNQVEHLKKESILKEKKSIFTKKNVVVIEKEQYNNLFNELKELYADNKRCNVLLDNFKNDKLESEELKEQNKELKRELEREKNKSFKRMLDNTRLQNTLDRLYKKYPGIKKDLEQSKEIRPGRKI